MGTSSANPRPARLAGFAAVFAACFTVSLSEPIPTALASLAATCTLTAQFGLWRRARQRKRAAPIAMAGVTILAAFGCPAALAAGLDVAVPAKTGMTLALITTWGTAGLLAASVADQWFKRSTAAQAVKDLVPALLSVAGIAGAFGFIGAARAPVTESMTFIATNCAGAKSVLPDGPSLTVEFDGRSQQTVPVLQGVAEFEAPAYYGLNHFELFVPEFSPEAMKSAVGATTWGEYWEITSRVLTLGQLRTESSQVVQVNVAPGC